jgi:ribosomal protein S18 acetylase RimI-like enzyme
MRESDLRYDAIRYAVRPLMGIDGADWERFFSHLNPSDIRDRFGHPVSVEAALRLLTLPNRYGSVIFGAFCPEGLVGVANLAKDDTGRAEIAVLVRSDWKRRRVGEALMRAVLCQAARERVQVYGFVRSSNSAIIGLLRGVGFVYGPRQIDYTTMHWRLAEPQQTTAQLAVPRASRREAIGGSRRTLLASGEGQGPVALERCDGHQRDAVACVRTAHAAQAKPSPVN